MTRFLISLDELDRVKRIHNLHSIVELAERTGMSRNTWSAALRTRRPTPQVLEALAALGARASKVLVSDEEMAAPRAA